MLLKVTVNVVAAFAVTVAIVPAIEGVTVTPVGVAESPCEIVPPFATEVAPLASVL